MTVLALEPAVKRLKENEDRIDIWVNDLGTYSTNNTPADTVETIRSFMVRKEAELNSYSGASLGETMVNNQTEFINANNSGSVTCICLTTPFSMSQNITLAKPLRVRPGATITTTGYTFACAGYPISAFTNCQVFVGTGTITGLYSAYVDWFGGFGDGSTNCATPLQKMANAGVREILFRPGRTYNINFTTWGSVVATFTSINGIKIIGAGAIINDVTTYSAGNSITLFGFYNCRGIFIDLTLQFVSADQYAGDGATGMVFFRFFGNASGACYGIFGGGYFTGGWRAFNFYRAQGNDESYVSKNIDLQVTAFNMYSPMIHEKSGYFANVKLYASNCYRPYYVIGGENLNLDIHCVNQKQSSIFDTFQGYALRNIDLKYYNRDSTAGSNGGALILFRFYGYSSGAGTMQNIKIDLNTKNPATTPWGTTLSLNKLTDGGAADTTGRGHILDGFTITGRSEQVDGANHVNQSGTFASSDVVSGINLKDLRCTGVSNGSSNILLPDFSDSVAGRLRVDNVYAPKSKINIIHGYSRTVFIGCVAYSLTGDTGNYSPQDYIDCEILSATYQNLYDKRLINTRLGAKEYTVVNGLSLNTGSMNDGAEVNLSRNGIAAQKGIIIVTRGDGVNAGHSAIFSLNGANNSVTEMLDSNNKFSGVKDTASSVNIYWNSTTYWIQNKTGTTLTAGVDVTYLTRMD
jgi:hypothetical protein